MKSTALFCSLLILSSCAVVRDFKEDALKISFNYDAISNGDSLETVLDKRGEPKQKLSANKEKMYLYRDGFILLSNNEVIERGSYDFTLEEGDTLSSVMKKGDDIFKVLPKLGLPLAVEKKEANTILRYNRGAVVVNGNTVLGSIDRFYTNLDFNLGINAFSDNSVPLDAEYFIAPGYSNLSPDDFLFKEAKGILVETLKERGVKFTDSKDKAKYILYLQYGIGNPSAEYRMTARWGGFQPDVQTTKTLTYNRWFVINALDKNHPKETKDITPRWRVIVNSMGSTGDLRVVLPVLIYGASDYLNTDTQREVYMTIEGKNMNDFYYNYKANELSGSNLVSTK